MLVFIDDSGDPGFKLNKGSTRFFVISAVIFDDNIEAEKAATAIRELRRDLSFPKNVEFKFFRSKPEVRIKFLKKVSNFDFRIRSIVMDKTIIHSDKFKSNKNSFYSYTIKTLLDHSDGSILNAKIKIDGSGDRIFRKSFLSYLRRELNSERNKIIKNCKLVDSKKNELIQMADMVAGTIKRSHDPDKKDGKKLKKILKKHIEDEWMFG
ncbi:MAG: DUF3800 domain-containing protein [bacterium]|nr:DUF3800 domain-containing protein [bacterium]